MARKVGINGLTPAINKILKDYADGVNEDVSKVIQRTGQRAAKTLREESRSKFKTHSDYHYAKGWTAKMEKSRYDAHSIVHNKNAPGLPHLLEHGHAKRGGGRVAGRPHIAPVEEAIISEFEREVAKNV